MRQAHQLTSKQVTRIISLYTKCSALRMSVNQGELSYSNIAKRHNTTPEAIENLVRCVREGKPTPGKYTGHCDQLLRLDVKRIAEARETISTLSNGNIAESFGVGRHAVEHIVAKHKDIVKNYY